MSNESNLDLDIDNYSISDFKTFFNLADNDKIQEIRAKIDATTNRLLFSDTSKYSNSDKKAILAFINKAKEIIIARTDGKMDMAVLKLKPDTDITKMVSGSPHFVQAVDSYPDKHVNPAAFEHRTKLIVLNSIYSDSAVNTGNSNTYTFTFPEQIKNVVGLTLAALQYPNVELAFTDYKGNNLMFIQENYTNTTNADGNSTTSEEDGYSATIRLPPGTYSNTNFSTTLEEQINLAMGYPTTGTDGAATSIFTLPRYSVNINPNSYQTTITNNLNPDLTNYPLALAYSKTFNGNYNFYSNFTIVFDKPTWSSNASSVCQPGFADNPHDPNFSTLTQAYQNNNLQYRSLGYQMGFREIVVSGSNTYTSLSIYNSNIINYVYFSLDDYITNRIDDVTAFFFNGTFDKNILALVPLTSTPFTSTLDSGANFIFKTRNYTGPVNLQKIAVTFYNPNGFIALLNGTPFAFALELKIAYENPGTMNSLNLGFDESGI